MRLCTWNCFQNRLLVLFNIYVTKRKKNPKKYTLKIIRHANFHFQVLPKVINTHEFYLQYVCTPYLHLKKEKRWDALMFVLFEQKRNSYFFCCTYSYAFLFCQEEVCSLYLVKQKWRRKCRRPAAVVVVAVVVFVVILLWQRDAA